MIWCKKIEIIPWNEKVENLEKKHWKGPGPLYSRLSDQVFITVVGCKAPFSLHGTSCFYATPDKYTWQDGRGKCQSLAGDLAMIKTAEKQQEAKEYINEIWESSDCASET